MYKMLMYFKTAMGKAKFFATIEKIKKSVGWTEISYEKEDQCLPPYVSMPKLEVTKGEKLFEVIKKDYEDQQKKQAEQIDESFIEE